jgi:hypothetical protein
MGEARPILKKSDEMNKMIRVINRKALCHIQNLDRSENIFFKWGC